MHINLAISKLIARLGHRDIARLILQRSDTPSFPYSCTLTPICGDMFAIPFSDETFHLTFNSGVIENYDSADRRRMILKEMSRVTKRNGFVSVMIPNKFHVFDPFWSKLISRCSDYDEYEIPEQKISLERLANEMCSAELSIVHAQAIGVYDTISHYPF